MEKCKAKKSSNSPGIGIRKKLSGHRYRKLASEKLSQEQKNLRTLKDLGWGKVSLPDAPSTSTLEHEHEQEENIQEYDWPEQEQDPSEKESNALRQTNPPNESTEDYENESQNLESHSQQQDINHLNEIEEIHEVIVPSDPALWGIVTPKLRSLIVLNGLPITPKKLPKDSSNRKFPLAALQDTFKNEESLKRDWIVWSDSEKALFCFPCSLFCIKEKYGAGKDSLFLRWNGGVKDNWRKLYNKIKIHHSNETHKTAYLDWKELVNQLKENSGIDEKSEKLLKMETDRWKEIFGCILDVTLFLASRNLAFRGNLF